VRADIFRCLWQFRPEIIRFWFQWSQCLDVLPNELRTAWRINIIKIKKTWSFVSWCLVIFDNTARIMDTRHLNEFRAAGFSSRRQSVVIPRQRARKFICTVLKWATQSPRTHNTSPRSAYCTQRCYPQPECLKVAKTVFQKYSFYSMKLQHVSSNATVEWFKIPASSRGSGFKSRPRDQLSWLWFFVVLLSPSRQMPW
jgi:hypothetical protein